MNCNRPCLQQPGHDRSLHGLLSPCTVCLQEPEAHLKAPQPCSPFLFPNCCMAYQQRHGDWCLFLQEGESQLKALRRLQRQAQDSFAHLVSFFGENPQALASDADFWSEVSLFVQRFSGCQRELRKQKLVSHPALLLRL